MTVWVLPSSLPDYKIGEEATTALRILLADDHEVVRRGLRALLEGQEDVKVCGEASDGREAIQKAARLKPDVAILDATMPVLGGLEAARQILKLAPETEILILTMHESEQMVCEALNAGAHGYVVKSEAGHELVAALRALRQHKMFFSPRAERIVRACSPDTKTRSDGLASRHLTQREREIVQLLAEGSSTKEVATTLGIAVKTAETHRTNIMRKLDVHSVVDLVRYALRNNIAVP